VSDFTDYIDALVADLTANVAALSSAVVHRYAVWDPGELEAFGSDRHLAVWPVGEAADLAEPLATGIHLLTQRYQVLVWEPETSDPSRAVVDEAGAANLLAIHNAIRDRLRQYANEGLSGSVRSWYVGTRLPDTLGRVRWFQITTERTIPMQFV